jgi:hypothetical protein
MEDNIERLIRQSLQTLNQQDKNISEAKTHLPMEINHLD